jgi:hypothetical protein
MSWSAGLASSHPLDYLADRFDPQAHSGGVFATLHALGPRHVVVDGLPAGAVVLAVPSARVDDAAPDACAQARTAGALLVTTAPASCAGEELYRDAMVRVVAPTGSDERFSRPRS